MAEPRGSVSGLDLLTKMTTTDMAVLNVVFVLCRNDEPRAPKDVAARFKDGTHQFATARMYRLVKVGAARWESTGGPPSCCPTEAGVAAMRFHYRQWRDVFTEADERKVLARA